MMKIRNRQDHSDTHVAIGEGSRYGIDESVYFLTEGGWVTKDSYEPIPEERWDDVTVQVQVSETGRGFTIATPSEIYLSCLLPPGHRFVKKSLFECTPASTQETTIDWLRDRLQSIHVLQVERKVSG